MQSVSSQLHSLADHFASRETAILKAWRDAAIADPRQTTASALPRVQFEDHIPEILECWVGLLRTAPDATQAGATGAEVHEQESKHGVQRWQQGYRLTELLQEWGLLHLVLADELAAFAENRPEVSPAVQVTANRMLIKLINEGMTTSATRYAQMERAEASSRANDLEKAIADLQNLDRRRTELIHQAVHDLRGNVQSVRDAVEILTTAESTPAVRDEFGLILRDGISTVGGMLGDLMELARLEAGREAMLVEPFDAAAVVLELCNVTRPRATAAGLYLKTAGVAALRVEGDANKVRRTLQNLLINALKYTVQGGVTVTWGEEPRHWWVKVQDTGPGLLGGTASPFVRELMEATRDARKVDEAGTDPSRGDSPVLDQQALGTAQPLPGRSAPGEGVGLSIIKRLCELLDARLELISSAENGTTFRVVIPRSYPHQARRAGPALT
ncbi:MAG TPA: sensor histidine kinase [Lacunisphaera sp.]|nr:sensor histidine kinase [Lacunisphaera sp.]